MNKVRYIVSWHYTGFVSSSKIYKYRKCAFAFLRKLLTYDNIEVTVETQEQKNDNWIVTERLIYD